MGWAQERWAASPHCWQSLTVGRQWSCAVSCRGEPCPEPVWLTASSTSWFLELWGAEALPGPGEELGAPSPLRVLGISVTQGPALWADPQAVSAWIPSLNRRVCHRWCPHPAHSNSLAAWLSLSGQSRRMAV